MKKKTKKIFRPNTKIKPKKGNHEPLRSLNINKNQTKNKKLLRLAIYHHLY